MNKPHYYSDPKQESNALLIQRLKLCSSVATGVAPSNKQQATYSSDDPTPNGLQDTYRR